LNAALILGRARRSVAIIDNNRPRNAVTHASHGFITREGVTPTEFRRIALEEVNSYPYVVVSEYPNLFHMAKLLHNWSKNLVVCTNGKASLSDEHKKQLQSKDIVVIAMSVNMDLTEEDFTVRGSTSMGNYGYKKSLISPLSWIGAVRTKAIRFQTCCLRR